MYPRMIGRARSDTTGTHTKNAATLSQRIKMNAHRRRGGQSKPSNWSGENETQVQNIRVGKHRRNCRYCILRSMVVHRVTASRIIYFGAYWVRLSWFPLWKSGK